jgi:uncharacterized membrane protein
VDLSPVPTWQGPALAPTVALQHAEADVVLVPGLWRSQRRAVQALSLVIQIYLTEGLVRATSDPGFSASLAWLETFLSTVVFAATLLWAKGTRGDGPAADPAEANDASKPH